MLVNVVNVVNSAQTVADRYREFSWQQARGRSDAHAELTARISHDAEFCDLLSGSLPAGNPQQPSLLLAAVRYLDGPHAEHGPRDETAYGRWREWTIRHWDEVRTVIMRRAGRTNDPGHCATLLPLLARLPQPLALLEVGASAGLCLRPELYRYRYEQAPGRAAACGASGGPVTLTCRTSAAGAGPVPEAPARVPEIVWRAGVDLDPLDPVADADDLRWLRALVWPGDRDRAERLAAAVGLARTVPRPRIVRGDLLDELPALAAEAPPGATLVIFHSAALALLPADRRERFAAVVRSLLAEREGRGHWISQEQHGVLPWITDPAHRAALRPEDASLTLALDERPLALTGPYGESLHWLAEGISAGTAGQPATG
ncbi:DUF2332 domain-containing protein [Streptomyces natalensis]|uniref:DUF2332 domain-containing protein n=1 Tax=Streptomyces natalensis TaxID=68242 RepID=UPI0005C984B1|nr:DUF2332 domain-containing protein [Streptomyces natalensis]